jgi:transposase InsO family protein
MSSCIDPCIIVEPDEDTNVSSIPLPFTFETPAGPSVAMLADAIAKEQAGTGESNEVSEALKRRVCRENIEPNNKRLEFWPLANDRNMSTEKRELLERRMQAVSGYFRGERLRELSRKWKISRWEIRRLRDRCLKTHPDGRIWGYRALIPEIRIRHYLRTAEARMTKTGRIGCGGLLARLFVVHPKVMNKVYRHYLRKRSGANEAYVPIASSHKVFVDACREEGMRTDEYPFNTRYLGIRALAYHLKSLLRSDLSAAVRATYGSEAAGKLRAGTGRIRRSAVTLPYQCVQFDGHRIHGIYTLMIPHPSGGFIEKIVERPWLLLVIDVVSRAILGWYLVPDVQYDSRDVLKAFDRAVRPWQPRTFTIPKLAYHRTAGMPSGTIDKLKWAIWGEISYDNAKSHLSDWVMQQLTTVLGCAVNPGAVKVPERRAIIEALFHVLNQRYLHRMPNTTGSDIKDHRGREAAKAAARFHISLTDLEELLEVIVANYNGTPHKELGYRSPLEQLNYFIETDAVLVRRLLPDEQARVTLLAMNETRLVVGDITQGRRPHINYLEERYTNEVLARSPDLIGTELTLVVDTDDLRTLTAFLPDGSELGILSAMGKWAQTPHSLTTRKLANSRRVLKVQHNADPGNPDPVLALIEDLSHEASSNKRAAMQLDEIRREAGLASDYHPMENRDISPEFTKPSIPVQKLRSPRRSVVY